MSGPKLDDWEFGPKEECHRLEFGLYSAFLAPASVVEPLFEVLMRSSGSRRDLEHWLRDQRLRVLNVRFRSRSRPIEFRNFGHHMGNPSSTSYRKLPPDTPKERRPCRPHSRPTS